MLHLHERGQLVDGLLVRDRLVVENELERVGGVTYLGLLIEGIARTESVRWYIDLVRRRSQVRALYNAAHRLQLLCLESPDSLDLTREAEHLISTAIDDTEKGEFVSVYEAGCEYLRAIEEGSGAGLQTGLKRWDFYTTGLQKQDLIIVGARPTMGKTSFTWDIARRVAKQGYVVAYFSAEMRRTQLAEKAISSDARLDSWLLRRNDLSSEQWSSAAHALVGLEGTPLYICDPPGLSAEHIAIRARALKRKQGRLDLVVVDYLQLLVASRRYESTNARVTHQSAQVKALAKELDCPLILCSQLSRSVEDRRPPHPRLSDLRDSGSLEQDADIVALLWKSGDADSNMLDVDIAKSRNGPTGEFKLLYLQEQNRFDNADATA